MALIVFDFDGPVFDGRKAAKSALMNTYEHFKDQFEVPKLDVDLLPLFPPKMFISLLYREANVSDREEIQNFYQEQLHTAEREVGVDRNLRDQLDRLIARGFKLAIFSGRRLDDLRSLLQDIGIGQYFSRLGCRPDYRKPSGHFFEDLALESRLPIPEILFLGDSDLDYMSAEAVGAIYYHAGWSSEPAAKAAEQAHAVFSSLAEFVDFLIDTGIYVTPQVDREELLQVVDEGLFSFCAGAGISIKSGFGNWQDQYSPILKQIGAGYLGEDPELPETLQSLAARQQVGQRIFNYFQKSFQKPHLHPNEFHFAMLRAKPDRIWTSNYDELFESAINRGEFERQTVHNDQELLNHFQDRYLLIKMNGDFQSAEWKDSLDWGLVFLQEQFDRADRDRAEIWRLFEDDYRHRSIVFVGLSLTDPALRRIVTNARAKIPRTRYSHYILVKKEIEPLARVKQVMFAESLEREFILTIFTDTYDEIQEFVERIALRASRPIVGFSGDVGHVSDELSYASTVPDGFNLTAGEIDSICRQLGQELARRRFRVTSGCAPFVGNAAVEAAFLQDPKSARFYLRNRGGTHYHGTAPVIVVQGNSYADMRNVFIPELSILVVIGGRAPKGLASGTIEEARMAITLGVPTVLLTPAGGEVGEQCGALRDLMKTAYKDDRLSEAVAFTNDTIAQIEPRRLAEFARYHFVDLIEKLSLNLMGTCTKFQGSPPW